MQCCPSTFNLLHLKGMYASITLSGHLYENLMGLSTDEYLKGPVRIERTMNNQWPWTRDIFLIPKSNQLIMGYFDPINCFLIIIKSNFWGHLSDISAKAATVPWIQDPEQQLTVICTNYIISVSISDDPKVRFPLQHGYCS